MTTTPTVPVTLLQAVNEMLAAVGTAQVMTLATADTNEETQKAVNTINDVAVQVQSESWNFNSDEAFPLPPDPVQGTITLPEGAQFMGLNWKSGNRKATVRNGQLWDQRNHTFIWANGTSGNTTPQPLTTSSGGTVTLSQSPANLGVLYCNLQFYFPFEQLPQPIRWLIMARAGRMWAVGRVPDPNTFKFTDTVYEDAYSLARQWDDEATSSEYWDNPHLRFMGQR